MYASFIALDLIKHVRAAAGAGAWKWLASGSLALGTGIWTMHFIGMLAFRLPLALGYRELQTVLSWLAAVAVSFVALWVTTREMSGIRLALGAAAMGAGICVMHYTGMAAIDLAPAIVWNAWLVAASAVIAVAASPLR